jgi:hypothetical protein
VSRLGEPARYWWWRHRRYRLLWPLWSALHQAMPEIALDRPRARAVDHCDLFRLRQRLYRRIVEIYDGRLALRQYYDDEVFHTATALALDQGLRGAELAAVAEAAQLKAALLAKTAGVAPCGSPAPVSLTGRTDLAAELAWLVALTRAFTGSAIVDRAVAVAGPTRARRTG